MGKLSSGWSRLPTNKTASDSVKHFQQARSRRHLDKELTMTGTQVLLLGTSLIASVLFLDQRCATAESVGGPIVRIAELEIDAGQIDAYRAALKEEIETSIRLEPGVLALLAVSLKEHPEQIRLFEAYRDAAAYG